MLPCALSLPLPSPCMFLPISCPIPLADAAAAVPVNAAIPAAAIVVVDEDCPFTDETEDPCLPSCLAEGFCRMSAWDAASVEFDVSCPSGAFRCSDGRADAPLDDVAVPVVPPDAKAAVPLVDACAVWLDDAAALLADVIPDAPCRLPSLPCPGAAFAVFLPVSAVPCAPWLSVPTSVAAIPAAAPSVAPAAAPASPAAVSLAPCVPSDVSAPSPTAPAAAAPAIPAAVPAAIPRPCPGRLPVCVPCCFPSSDFGSMPIGFLPWFCPGCLPPIPGMPFASPPGPGRAGTGLPGGR